MRLRLRSTVLALGAILACCGPAWAGAPPDPDALAIARAREVADDAGGAIADLRAYVAAHPADGPASRLLGDLYFRTGDLQAAAKTWRAELARVPQDGETHARLGGLYAAAGRDLEAIDEYHQALPLRSALVALVRLHMRHGDYAAFAGDLEAQTEENRADSNVLSEYANVLQASGHLGDALVYYNRVVVMRPNSCDSLIDRAGDLVSLGRYADGVVDLQRCLHTDPNNYAALTELGTAYLDANDPAAARPLLERALERNPAGVEALVNLGCLEDASGNWQQALDRYRAALAADPLRPEAYIDMGYDELGRRFYAAAEDTIVSGLRAAPENGRLHYLLAKTFRLEGKTELARLQYEEAIRSDDQLVVRAAKTELLQLVVGQ